MKAYSSGLQYEKDVDYVLKHLLDAGDEPRAHSSLKSEVGEN